MLPGQSPLAMSLGSDQGRKVGGSVVWVVGKVAGKCFFILSVMGMLGEVEGSFSAVGMFQRRGENAGGWITSKGCWGGGDDEG